MTVAAIIAVAGIAGGFFLPLAFGLVPIAAVVFYWLRRKTRRRLAVIGQEFPASWESILRSRVEFFVALSPEEQERFRNLMKVFLDEVAITGIRTDVDEVTRVLVAASAVIPILGFDDFEYATLGEVLIYPGSFDDKYKTEGNANANTLGMVGVNHLSGVMILSKPSLIAGFDNTTDKRNVGIHEFAHLVDKADGEVDGVPPLADPADLNPWVRWVGEELRRDATSHEHIDDYAFTNEAEYFAVLSEYFFETPTLLQQRNPKLYDMLRKMYHQDTQRLLSGRPKRRRVGRNSPCPCGSGEKYKRCCKRHVAK
ncbi:zinc-dependent peptidase [Neorhodopirellula lusitana]|uniref:zinc-dependent peptidase n=1 Tax=Neorhodopirellula lusitana TaxID=445327 RepID=UPI00384F80AA